MLAPDHYYDSFGSLGLGLLDAIGGGVAFYVVHSELDSELVGHRALVDDLVQDVLVLDRRVLVQNRHIRPEDVLRARAILEQRLRVVRAAISLARHFLFGLLLVRGGRSILALGAQMQPALEGMGPGCRRISPALARNVAVVGLDLVLLRQLVDQADVRAVLAHALRLDGCRCRPMQSRALPLNSLRDAQHRGNNHKNIPKLHFSSLEPRKHDMRSNTTTSPSELLNLNGPL